MTYFLVKTEQHSYWVEASTATEAAQRFDYVYPYAGRTTVHQHSVTTLPADSTYVCLGIHRA